MSKLWSGARERERGCDTYGSRVADRRDETDIASQACGLLGLWLVVAWRARNATTGTAVDHTVYRDHVQHGLGVGMLVVHVGAVKVPHEHVFSGLELVGDGGAVDVGTEETTVVAVDQELQRGHARAVHERVGEGDGAAERAYVHHEAEPNVDALAGVAASVNVGGGELPAVVGAVVALAVGVDVAVVPAVPRVEDELWQRGRADAARLARVFAVTVVAGRARDAHARRIDRLEARGALRTRQAILTSRLRTERVAA